MILADQSLDALEKKNRRTDTPKGIGTMRKILEAEHLCKTFNGKAVLNEISFQVEEGEVFGLLGPNGAGKTTMIRIILDILKPDSGMVHLFGRQIDEKTKELIGYLPHFASPNHLPCQIPQQGKDSHNYSLMTYPGMNGSGKQL